MYIDKNKIQNQFKNQSSGIWNENLVFFFVSTGILGIYNKIYEIVCRLEASLSVPSYYNQTNTPMNESTQKANSVRQIDNR